MHHLSVRDRNLVAYYAVIHNYSNISKKLDLNGCSLAVLYCCVPKNYQNWPMFLAQLFNKNQGFL